MVDTNIENLEARPKDPMSIMLEVVCTASELDRALAKLNEAREEVILAQAAHNEAYRQLDEDAKLRALEIPQVADVHSKINNGYIDGQLRA